jgi:hypothetical protein
MSRTQTRANPGTEAAQPVIMRVLRVEEDVKPDRSGGRTKPAHRVSAMRVIGAGILRGTNHQMVVQCPRDRRNLARALRSSVEIRSTPARSVWDHTFSRAPGRRGVPQTRSCCPRRSAVLAISRNRRNSCTGMGPIPSQLKCQLHWRLSQSPRRPGPTKSYGAPPAGRRSTLNRGSRAAATASPGWWLLTITRTGGYGAAASIDPTGTREGYWSSSRPRTWTVSKGGVLMSSNKNNGPLLAAAPLERDIRVCSGRR